MNCPYCGAENAPGHRFCINCGEPLPEETRQGTPLLVSEGGPPPVRVEMPPAPARIGQMGADGTAAMNIWGPFAGYGTRGRHVAWLLNDLGERAEALRDAITRRFEQRGIPNARVQQVKLTGRGIGVEQRPFYLIQRGIATVGLYIARFGRDLYISQVTYAQGPLNTLRVLVVALMVLFELYFLFGYTSALAEAMGGSFFSGPDTEALLPLLCCVGPLGYLNSLALGLLALFSLYKFLTEKDPLAFLRTPPNEFEQDDIIALEKSVEQTVREALDVIGIDSKLMPPAAEYGIKRRLI